MGQLLGERTCRMTLCHDLCKMAELIDLPFGLWTQVGWRKHGFSRICQVAPTCPPMRTRWRHLTNICGGDVALCLMTLTTCYYCTWTVYSNTIAKTLRALFVIWGVAGDSTIKECLQFLSEGDEHSVDCAWTISFDQSDLPPRYLACLFILTLFKSSSQIKVTG